MITIQTENLNLAAIADSGQCFRWKQWKGGYRIAAMNRAVYVRQPRADTLEIDCTQEEFYGLWKDYFDLDTDYGAIIRSISAGDAYLTAAAAHGSGIRILRQEPWETLITFIISQRKNIPAIRQAVEKLCAACGKRVDSDPAEPVYAFPSPREIARLSPEALRACGLGYRVPYVHRAAEAFCREEFTMDALRGLDDGALLEALCRLHGVGRKVAQCVLLFGFHRMNAFPLDVWMHRVGEKRYPDGIPVAAYSPWAGVMQQYMFAYERYLEGKA